MELKAAASDLADLHRELFAFAPAEGAAFLAVEPSAGCLGLRSTRVFRADELEVAEGGELVIAEDAQMHGLADLKRRGHGLVEVHTHPGSGADLDFSPFDEEQMPAFARYVQHKMPGRPFGALVLGEHGYVGRIYQGDLAQPLVLCPAGEAAAIPTWLESQVTAPPPDARFDRQVRYLGPAGQERLSRLRVGIVGLGGTGSIVAQQLAHLGIRDFVLVEDDRVEATNLNRLAMASWRDAIIRREKASVARRGIHRIARRVRVRRTGSLRRVQSLTALSQRDLIVGCVDNDGARLILSELASAHLVPYLDVGVGIEAAPVDAAMGGRIAFHLPGEPCLACADELDFAEAAEDLESEGQRRIRVARGYATDRRVEPALMPLNTVLAGMAMLELLAYVTGVRAVVPFVRFDALNDRIVRRNVELDNDCPICRAASGMGDRQRIARYAVGGPAA